MNTYTIFCSEEQTKLAYKLGAPITCLPMAIPLHVENMVTIIETNQTLLNPTAEQMRGWLLAEKDICVEVHRHSGKENTYISVVNEFPYSTSHDNKTATLAAIDIALLWLEKANL